MQFDPRTAKALLPGQHMAFDDYSGLRLFAMAKVRTWFIEALLMETFDKYRLVVGGLCHSHWLLSLGKL